MRNLKIAALAGLSATLMSGAAMAADLLEPVTDVADTVDASAWDGLYVGVGATGLSNGGSGVFFLDGYLGANVTMDSFLLGGELALSAWTTGSSSGWAFSTEGRVGFVIDSAVIYGGLGYMNNSFVDWWTVGLGAEFMVADSTSIDIEYKYGVPITASNPNQSISASVLWHF